jgi:aryl-alcohol dehydrogenase-like predicted oxidoreductase
MSNGNGQINAAASGTFVLGGDLEINRMGFGAMRITGKGIWGRPDDVENARAVVRRCVDLGVNFIDTADSYGPNASEEIIAEALHPYADSVVIATKGGQVRPGPGEWKRSGRPEALRQALEGSLQRLRLEVIDLYQMHRHDPEVPYAESIGEIARMQQEGKIRHVGLSNVTPEQLAIGQGVTKIVSVQNEYNVFDRRSEAVLEICEAENMAFIPWYPFSAGKLETQKLEQVAPKYDATPYQVALAWLLKRSPVMLPIPGTGSLAHLEENIAASHINLSDEDFAFLGD